MTDGTTATANKVEFGLTNVYFAPMLTNTGSSATYETPIRIPGAVELSLSANGSLVEFEADNGTYYASQNNQGYEGTATFALLPDIFKEKCLGEIKDEVTGAMIEVSNAQSKPFALLFQFEGDSSGRRHVLYNCVANRPNDGSKTKGDGTPNTKELTFRAMPRIKDHKVKARTSDETKLTVYDNWFTKVFETA